MIAIYKITSPSGKVYIGQSWNIKRRTYIYRLGHCKSQRHLYSSLVKYGFENHMFEIIHEFASNVQQSTLNYYEDFYIKSHASSGHVLMNLRGGGASGKFSEETKDRLRRRMLGTHPSPETRKKLSAWQTGRKRPHVIESNARRAAKGEMFFQTLLPGQPRPMSGRKHSEETRQRMSISRKGIGGWRHSEFTKEKYRLRSRGESNPAAILTEAKVLEIRAKYQPRKYTRKMLADEYVVSVHTIAGIVDGRLWPRLFDRQQDKVAA